MAVIKGKSQKFAKKNKSTKPGIGASGTTNFQGTIDTGEYVVKLQGEELYTTIDKMRWSDASVQAALLMCELPIRSAEWDVEQGSDDAQGEEIKEFIKDCLFDGLLMNWDDTVRNILLMHPFGVMVFEVVYKIREDGKIGWRKWAPRLPKTIEKWNIDKNGELESIMQRAYKDNDLREFTIPVEKLMVFTYRQEGDNYLGTSILRQVYKHWFFRDKYYKIDAVATERNGIGIPVVTLPDGFSDDDYDDAEKMAENVRGHEKAYIIKKIGWEFEFADQKAATLKDPKEMLEHHTREILKSVLAQFIDLGGGAGGSTGSYALAKEQSSMFLQALDASAKKVEEVVNEEIKKLVDFNYTVAPDEYPKLTHSDLGTKDIKELAEALQSLMFSGAIMADDKLEDYLRTVLKLPEKEKSVEGDDRQQRGQPKEKEPDDAGKDDDKKKTPDSQKHSEKYHRALTKAESRVKFDEIRDFMDQAQNETLRKMLNVLKMEQARLLPIFREAIIKKDFVALQQISWQLKGKYSQVFKEQIKKMFEYGKLKASYEIKKPAPMTTSEINKTIAERAFFLANRHEAMMMEDIKGIAAVCMMDPNISDTEAVSKITAGFEKYNTRNAQATASLVTSEEINNGRKYTFESFKDDLYGYQWSAILDGATCNYCQSMDGRVIGVEDKAFSAYKPGAVHFSCRCIWVAIMKEEVSPPPFTGIPDQLRPQSVMPAWQFKDLEYPLPGSGKRKMPYGIGVFKEFGNLPDDVIWRTIGGKRVPISPSTGKPVGGWKSKKKSDSGEKKEPFLKDDEQIVISEKGEAYTGKKEGDRRITQDITYDDDIIKQFGNEGEIGAYEDWNNSAGEWFREAKNSGKDRVLEAMDEGGFYDYSLFEWYRHTENCGLTYDKWLETPMEVYRGTTGKKVGDVAFVSFTPDKSIAKSFGKVVSIKIRPGDMLGFEGNFMEDEILVPPEKAGKIMSEKDKGKKPDDEIDEFAKYLHSKKRKNAKK